MQHVMLGKVLHGAYHRFLTSFRSSEQLYVRSTNYERTIQSAGALLSALLPSTSLSGVNKVKTHCQLKLLPILCSMMDIDRLLFVISSMKKMK
jgi:hypothetical protein